jgi:four helix bundle protein
MDTIRSYRDLEVWRMSMELATGVYQLTESLPASERYGLTSQIRRAATSIPANLAEGHSRPAQAYRNHVNIAIGSQAELETLIELAGRLNFVASEQVTPIAPMLKQTGRMLKALAKALKVC